MTGLAGLTTLDATWAAAYSDSPVLRTVRGFARGGGLVVAGGWAITADWGVFVARGPAALRGDPITRMRVSHRYVLWGLVIVFISGLLLFASDVNTYPTSIVFWSKMGGIALLAANGAWLQSLARDVASRPERWISLRRSAFFSIVLWGAITLLGSALPNVG